MKGTDKYEVGWRKPPKEHQFKKGAINNPCGKTSAQKLMENENARLAQAAANRTLKALTAAQAPKTTEELLAGLTGSDILRLISNAQDRAFGFPSQPVSVDGTVNVVISKDDAGL